MGCYAGVAFHHPDQRTERRTHGTYLGLFNGTICIPQIVAASLGGSILALFTPKGMLPPEINMLVMAGVMLIIGAVCVYLIKETKGEQTKA